MRRAKLNFEKFHWIHFPVLAVVAILLTGCFPARSLAQQNGQKTFSSAEDASAALLAATRSNDEKALLEILGPDGKQIVSSGDDAEDALSRANFVEKFQEMHRLVKEPDGTVTLYIGAHNWPTPIPIVSNGNSWYFNTDAGKSEILARRIGRNEMSAIRVNQELAAAQKEYVRALSLLKSIVEDGKEVKILRAEPQRFFDCLAHGPTKRDSLLELGRNLFRLQLGVQFRLMNLLDRNQDFPAGCGESPASR